MFQFEVTPELLLVVVAGTLALIFDYFPGVAKWFDAQTVERKRQINALLVIGSAIVLFTGTCFAIFITNLVCDVRGVLDLLKIVFLAVSVNQGVHLLFKPGKQLKARMFGR